MQIGALLTHTLLQDWGTSPAAIDAALDIGDRFDVQVNIHSDTLNEAGFVEDTIGAFKGRTIHTYHTEGAGCVHRARSSSLPRSPRPSLTLEPLAEAVTHLVSSLVLLTATVSMSL